MIPLPPTATDAGLVAFIDQWAALLEREDYEGAFALTDHIADIEMKKVPGTIDCLSDVFVLGLWRVLLDFYPTVREEWLRLPVSGC